MSKKDLLKLKEFQEKEAKEMEKQAKKEELKVIKKCSE